MNVFIYEGEPERAFALIESQHPVYRRSQLTRGDGTASTGYAAYRARCAAALLGKQKPGDKDAGQLLAIIRASIAMLRRRTSAKALGFAEALTATMANHRGDLALTRAALARAIQHFDAAGVLVHAAAARRRLGHLLEDGGRPLLEAGDGAMRTQAIENIEAMTELVCPGCTPQ